MQSPIKTKQSDSRGVHLYKTKNETCKEWACAMASFILQAEYICCSNLLLEVQISFWPIAAIYQLITHTYQGKWPICAKLCKNIVWFDFSGFVNLTPSDNLWKSLPYSTLICQFWSQLCCLINKHLCFSYSVLEFAFWKSPRFSFLCFFSPNCRRKRRIVSSLSVPLAERKEN